eukprot:1367094-Prymnesium_polylepis.3
MDPAVTRLQVHASACGGTRPSLRGGHAERRGRDRGRSGSPFAEALPSGPRAPGAEGRVCPARASHTGRLGLVEAAAVARRRRALGVRIPRARRGGRLTSAEIVWLARLHLQSGSVVGWFPWLGEVSEGCRRGVGGVARVVGMIIYRIPSRSQGLARGGALGRRDFVRPEFIAMLYDA